jgi:GDP/UDP-N,N'-diacetylbacillosamine 2-epimerase (hydrolysing)
MKRKICVVTGTRAEYGLLRWVLEEIKNDPDLVLQLLVTGSHLSHEFGMTYQQIIDDGYEINKKVEILLSSDSPVGIAKSMGLGFIGFADALSELQPDILVLLGDRFEIFAVAATALVMNIPIAHLHGGETTEGAFDEAFRHAITKMSHLHFVAAEEYSKRAIQLGESPTTVFQVGGLGVDGIKRMPLMTLSELESSLDFKFGKKNLLVTFHPVTLEPGSAESQMSALLESLSNLTDTHIIFTAPNADTGGRGLIDILEKYVRNHDNTKLYKSLGQKRYLSCLAYIDAVIGNSSSGLLEAPSFKIGTINIGDRQGGRTQATSVINAAPDSANIDRALAHLYSAEFQKTLANTVNPYGDGGASEKIVSIIKSHDLTGLRKKKFFDLPIVSSEG